MTATAGAMTSDAPLERRPVPLREAFVAAALAGSIFLALYSFTNWLSSIRYDVGTWQFAWEKHIPFVPWMILPYLSIDVLFVACFFVCTSRSELWGHFKRIAAANVIATICFLVFPLRMAMQRPEHLEGPLSFIYRLTYTFDRPYNLVPSLHIAQGLLVWVIFARHTRGALRWIVHGWFILIGVSTLLTYQHGVPDVITGWMLGILCLWMFPDRDVRNADGTKNRDGSYFSSGSGNPRVGLRWAAVAVLVLLLAVLLRPWGWLLIWPAFAAGVVAASYFRLGPGVFRKRAGRIDPATRWLLFPYLAGDRIARLHIVRGGQPWARITPELVLGRRVTRREARRLIAEEEIVAVLDLTVECPECGPLLELPYRNLQVLDLTVPTAAQFDAAIAFIREHRERGSIYLHCALGYSRSAAVAAAYLLREGACDSVEEAIAQVRRARPRIKLKQDSLAALQDYHSGTKVPLTQ